MARLYIAQPAPPGDRWRRSGPAPLLPARSILSPALPLRADLTLRQAATISPLSRRRILGWIGSYPVPRYRRLYMLTTEQEFLDTYFFNVGDIWQLYFDGKIPLSKRDRLLEGYRSQLRRMSK